MDFLVVVIIILVIGGGILGALWPFLIMLFAIHQYSRFQAAIAEQARALQQTNGLAAQPALQDQFAEAARAAAGAVNALKGQRAAAAQHELFDMLMKASQTLPQGKWSNGGYIEGGNIVIPNGPSIINGQLYITR